MPQCRFLLRPLPTLLWDRVHVGLLLTWHDAYALWYTPFFLYLSKHSFLSLAGCLTFRAPSPDPPPCCARAYARQTMVSDKPWCLLDLS